MTSFAQKLGIHRDSDKDKRLFCASSHHVVCHLALSTPWPRNHNNGFHGSTTFDQRFAMNTRGRLLRELCGDDGLTFRAHEPSAADMAVTPSAVMDPFQWHRRRGQLHFWVWESISHWLWLLVYGIAFALPKTYSVYTDSWTRIVHPKPEIDSLWSESKVLTHKNHWNLFWKIQCSHWTKANAKVNFFFNLCRYSL